MKIALVLLSAALTALALPPWEVTGVAWIGLVPLFIALRGTNVRGVFGLGLLWGVAHHWATAYWVLPAMSTYYLQPLWLAFAFGAVSSLLYRGSYGALFALVASGGGRAAGPFRRCALPAAAWAGLEVSRAQWLTHDPWLLLGYALLPYERLIQIADVTGVYGLSFLVVFVNAALAGAESYARSRGPEFGRGSPFSSIGEVLGAVVAAAAMLAAAWTYGQIRLAAPLATSPSVAVAVVQGNHALGAQWRPELHGDTLKDYVRLSLASLRGRRPDVLVWPESAVTFFLAHDAAYRAAVERFVRQAGVELILGTPHYEKVGAETRFFSSAFRVRSGGGLDGRFDKRQLLPFVETFPLGADSLLRRRFGRMRTMTPGERDAPLDTRLGAAAVAICFEAIFPHVVRRRTAEADVLLNLSNDVWLGEGAGPRQHFAMVVLRAIENRTWVIRSTTTGITAVIDPRGRIVEHLPRGSEGVIAAAVVPQRVDTPYERSGDLFAFACLAFAVWSVAARWTGRRDGTEIFAQRR